MVTLLAAVLGGAIAATFAVVFPGRSKAPEFTPEPLSLVDTPSPLIPAVTATPVSTPTATPEAQQTVSNFRPAPAPVPAPARPAATRRPAAKPQPTTTPCNDEINDCPDTPTPRPSHTPRPSDTAPPPT